MFNQGALSLLRSYGGDSSDDDVPGPRVSTKRSHKSNTEDVSEEPVLKKRFILNVTIYFLNLCIFAITFQVTYS